MSDEPQRHLQTDQLRERRRRETRARRRRRRVLTLSVVVFLAVFVVVAFAVLPAIQRKASHGSRPPKETAAKPQATASPRASASPSATWSKTTPTPVKESPTPVSENSGSAPAKPAIVQRPITFGAKRQAEMAAYSKRHYGQSTWQLDPRAIVIHYTAGNDVNSAWNLFQSDQPNVSELPGTVAHFIVGEDGTIYQLIPLDVRGRHTIGLNQVAIGIEFVQPQGSGDTWATGQILHRTAQVAAGVRLVRWLQARFNIPTADVLGHGTANASPLFKDLKGWTNDHADWGAGPLQRFKALLKKAGG